MASVAVEAANVCVGLSLFITFIVTLSVAAANNGFVSVDDTGVGNNTRAALHSAQEAVTDELSSLDIDIDTYGPAIKVGCQLAEIECPTKISGVAVASIVTGILSLLSLIVALVLRARRRSKYANRGRVQLYPDL
jgi:hypothetical protein